MFSGRHSVLIVDDDPEIVEILKEHFRERNFEVVSTTDPLKAVDALKSFGIKLLVLDIKMRNLDGFGVLDRIKQAGLEIPPTIIITGFLPKYIDRLKDYGLTETDVVKKPFDFDILENAINKKLSDQILPAEVGSEYESRMYKTNRCRLGVVEDEEDLLMYFKEFFGERNYKLSFYKNGTDAYTGLKENPVDILFVDIKIPGMQGDELIEKLKRDNALPYTIPISADPLFDSLAARLKEAGCHEYISKPFEIDELIELVKTIAIKQGLLDASKD